MSNVLTGDFDAVLELSGSTLTRLCATMHQNAGADPARPELPHVGHFRIEGGSDAPGVRGSVAVQIGVPQVALIHAASDRFRLHVGIRARYRADPGSAALADILHGTVRAEYRLEEVDPNCFGWRGIAADYLWARVIKDTVVFDGVLLNDSAVFSSVLVFDEALVKQRVERLLATLLDTGFAPRPHKVAASLRRFRGLAAGVGLLRAAVAIPVGLDGEVPAGDLASVNELFLDGHDFGLAVSRESIMARVAPRLQPLAGLQRDFHIHGDAGFGGGLEIDYHVRVDGVTAEWIGPLSIPVFPMPGGLIRVRANGQGWCSRLYRSGVFNIPGIHARDLAMTFSVDQFLLLGFDPGAERLTVTAFGTPAATLNYNGPFAGYVVELARNAIVGELQSRLGGALAQAQNDLAFLTAPARKAPLIEQLRQIDGAAAARFTDAAFRSEGLILHGTIALSHRHPPRLSFEKTPGADGFDAIESWIPGGRVDSFEWTWRWFTSGVEGAPGPPGASTLEESFILRRPTQRSTRFAASMNLEQSLPGLDGPGRLCLVIRGIQVDHDTGDFVPVTSVMDCAQFGYEFRIPALIGLYMRLHDPLAGLEATGAAEIGVLRLGATDSGGSNTLALYLGDAWHEDAVATLRAGLDQCRREGAGLLVALLFKEGKRTLCEGELQAWLRELAETLAAPLMVSEDVRGGWAEALALPVDGRAPSWRLIAPDGRISWSHDGRADAGLLAAVLDERLVASLPPGLARIGPYAEIGVRLPIELVTPHCPPVPLWRFATTGTRLIFVHRERAAAVAQVARRSFGDPEQVEAPPYVAIVVEGASAQEAEALAKAWKLDIPIFPDPAGAITRQAGVRLSPSTLILDDAGRLASWQPGVELGVGQAKTNRDRAERGDAS